MRLLVFLFALFCSFSSELELEFEESRPASMVVIAFYICVL